MNENIKITTPSQLRAMRLVPVEVFGANECVHCYGTTCACGATDAFGYGLSDAVSSWSDCNRAVGRIYRFDEPEMHRVAGDTLTVWVDPAEFERFHARRFGDLS